MYICGLCTFDFWNILPWLDVFFFQTSLSMLMPKAVDIVVHASCCPNVTNTVTMVLTLPNGGEAGVNKWMVAAACHAMVHEIRFCSKKPRKILRVCGKGENTKPKQTETHKRNNKQEPTGTNPPTNPPANHKAQPTPDTPTRKHKDERENRTKPRNGRTKKTNTQKPKARAARRNEEERHETKQNETRRDETKRTETKGKGN